MKYFRKYRVQIKACHAAMHQSAIREKRHVRVAPGWNLIRALARVNTRIVHSSALNG